MYSARLRALLNERNLGASEFAEMCDLPLETVKNFYYGKTTDPKISTVEKMASALNMDINCFIGKCAHTTAEKILLRNYRDCGRHGRSVIELIAKYESGAIKSVRDAKNKHQIPCLVPRDHLFNGIVYDTCESIEIETTNDDAFFSIQMINNDLAPIFCKGDFILLENRFPNCNEYAAFLYKDRVYIRKYIEEEKQYRLKCLHNQGDDLVFKRMDEVDYIGTCIDVVRL